MGAIGETGSFYWRVAERDHQEGDDVSNSGEVTTVEMTHTMSDNSDDLTPLRAFTGLKTLTINGGPLRLDLPPLTSTPLESLTCRELIAHRNAHILKSMPKLTTTDAQPEPIAVSTSVINTEP